MFSLSFKNVSIEAIGLNLPPTEVTSLQIEEQLGDLYKRLEIPFGTLERMSGVKTRYFWEDSIPPSVVATAAAERALMQTNIKPSEVGAIFSCSVARDYFEPATATLVHRNLGLREDSLALDITNACVGFSNGLAIAGSMIESGAIKSALVVSGEPVSKAVNICLAQMSANRSIDRETLLSLLPTVTLGSGSVAYLLCHQSIASTSHRYVGCVTRSASQHNDLCVGDADYCHTQKDYLPMMTTDAPKLIASAAQVGARAWQDFTAFFGWGADELNHIICHQVGRQVNDAFYRTIGLDRAKEFNIYPKYGNMVSAALPSAFAMAIDGRGIRPGDKTLLMGYGSGLNSVFSGVIW